MVFGTEVAEIVDEGVKVWVMVTLRVVGGSEVHDRAMLESVLVFWGWVMVSVMVDEQDPDPEGDAVQCVGVRVSVKVRVAEHCEEIDPELEELIVELLQPDANTVVVETN